MGDRPTIAFYTLGCKVNQADTARIKDAFVRAGFEVVAFSDQAEVYVINSCTVTTTASQKTRQITRSVRRRAPVARILLCGCYPEVGRRGVVHGEFSALETLPVDRLLGVEEPQTVVSEVMRLLPAETRCDDFGYASPDGEVTRPVVVAQRGCDGGCTYCIVPLARGPLYSEPLAEVKREIESHLRRGAREIVLAGIHLAAYGRDRSGSFDLGDLVTEVTALPGEWRLRISSLEPMDLTPALVERLFARERVAPHAHLPLQSGSDGVLGRMGRLYDTLHYRSLVDAVRKVAPEAGITTDIMVGFPGETEDEHRQSMEFAESVAFSRLHVFSYSKRPGTAAACFSDPVPGDVARDRRDDFLSLGKVLSRDFYASQVETVLRVVLEEPLNSRRDTPTYFGYAENYVPVTVVANPWDRRGSMIPVRIDRASVDGCVGRSLSRGKN